ncbi:MAG: hypothetical protein KME16_04825 [Scytolyngbya sp. HA4215-MV1]|jgi:hypothetical protein|nr:hypothetical protein [Scytolyngbya sp. HA4215-MV1]
MTILTTLVGLSATIFPAQADSVVIVDGNVYIQSGRSHVHRTRSENSNVPVYRSPNDIPNGEAGYSRSYNSPNAYPYNLNNGGCYSGYCAPIIRVQVRTIPFEGEHQKVDHSILVNPTIINSEIQNSTLINPVIIDSSGYVDGSTQGQRFYIMNGSY